MGFARRLLSLICLIPALCLGQTSSIEILARSEDSAGQRLVAAIRERIRAFPAMTLTSFVLVTIVLSAAPKLLLVRDAIPDSVEELVYATSNNFMSQKVYPDSARCYLRQESLDRLVEACLVIAVPEA